MTQLTYAPEQAQALADQYDLMVHETAHLDWILDIAAHVHVERVRRLYEWGVAEGMSPPEPCCPYECVDCNEEHICVDISCCMQPYPSGMEWFDEDGVLAQVPFEVLWANDPDKTEALIADQVEKFKTTMLTVIEKHEMVERAHLAELQHKYGESS
jgi:hypothetical protein